MTAPTPSETTPATPADTQRASAASVAPPAADAATHTPGVGDMATFCLRGRELTGKVVSRYGPAHKPWLVIETGLGPEDRWHVPEEKAARAKAEGRDHG